MPNLVEVHYEQTGASKSTNEFGMRDMQEKAHHQLDLAIEKCYRNKPFENDEERLEYLFGFYEEMIRDEGKSWNIYNFLH